MLISPFTSDFGFACKRSCEKPLFVLCPAEAALLPPYAVASRKSSFYLGRWAAHTALAQLTCDDGAIVNDSFRAPVWPPDIVGSISHTDDIAVAAVARRTTAACLGLDIEKNARRVEWDVARKICDKEELAWVEQEEIHKWQRFIHIFSAKESVFKAFFPLQKIFLDFHDAHLEWQEASGCFRGYLRKQAAAGYNEGYAFAVGCRNCGEYVLTYLALPAEH